jgi:hypothetical protein
MNLNDLTQQQQTLNLRFPPTSPYKREGQLGDDSLENGSPDNSSISGLLNFDFADSPKRSPQTRGSPNQDSPKRSCYQDGAESPVRGMSFFESPSKRHCGKESPTPAGLLEFGTPPPARLFDVETRHSYQEVENTSPPSPYGMKNGNQGSSIQGSLVSKKYAGSFSPVVVVQNLDEHTKVKKSFYVAGEKVNSKIMSGLKTKCPEYNIMLWNDWLKNEYAHMHYSGQASKHFVKTFGINTIKDGGDYGLWIFEMTMEYALPILDFLSSKPDKRNDLARQYFSTLKNINIELLENRVVLEDPHPRNCGLRFLPDGTFELVFFDLQFSTIEKGINIPSEYVFEMTSDLTGNERKALKKRQALLLMVESIRLYDPRRQRKEHLQEIASNLNIGSMSLEQVDLALGAFLS